MYFFLGVFTWLCMGKLFHAEEHCVMHGNCDIDAKTGFTRPCVYDGDAIPLELSAINAVKKLCPTLKTGSDFSVCCSADQIEVFENQINQLAVLFKRCPSCYHNLANVFCLLYCSPIQSSFLRVLNYSSSAKGQSVNEIDYFITEDFTSGLYNSCKNVKLSYTMTPAIQIACGTRITNCNPHLWLEFMGAHNPSPYQINFHYKTSSNITVNQTTFYPMNETIIPCSQAVGTEGVACSCIDCPCHPQPPPLPPNSDQFFLGLPLIKAILLIVYSVLSFAIIGVFIYAHYHKGSNDEQLLVIDSDRFQRKVSLCEKLGMPFDAWLKNIFTHWGFFCASHPILILLIGLILCIIFSCGLFFFTIISDPVELWSVPRSLAREQKQYFNDHFGSLYRTEQVIITRKTQDPVVGNNLTFSSVFSRDFLHQILKLQTDLENLTAKRNGSDVYLEDICFSPVKKGKCMIQSPVSWFQNNAKNLDYYNNTDAYLEFLQNCISNPYLIQKNGISCLSEYGGPVFPYISLGGVEKKNYSNASAVIITFRLKNYLNASANVDAEAWEEKFIAYLKSYNNSDMKLAFTSERSFKDELDRMTHSEENTILITFLVMFAYVCITLGQFHSFGILCVQSKIIFSLSGILIVFSSVVSSLGILSCIGVPATSNTIVVISFLLLVVGVDNIFILVHAYQRSKRREIETQQYIGRMVGEIFPSILLASFAESSCCFFCGLSSVPVIYIFALYSGLALLINFIFQVSCFVAVLSFDAVRNEQSGMYACCGVKREDSESNSEQQNILENFFEKYASFLMKDYIRCLVLLVFLGFLCLSISVIPNIDVGLDQKLLLPKESYALDYFNYAENYMSVGPPVYFVMKTGYNYSSLDHQNSLCSVAYCNRESLVTQISDACQFPNRTYIAYPPMDWLDSYIHWANDQIGCCRVYVNDASKFCPSSVQAGLCRPCKLTDEKYFRPHPNQFNSFLVEFLNDNPTSDCLVTGQSGFAEAIQLLENNTIGATHYETHNTVLKTSSDYLEALRWARKIADNISLSLDSSNTIESKAEVFPYSPFHVLYEYYFTITHDAAISLAVSVATVFLSAVMLMGLDFHSAALMVFVILMILFDLIGFMYLWNISLNAMSFVNLGMNIGISVAFCVYIIHSFVFNEEGSRVARAKVAVNYMGSPVLCGVILTKIVALVVLALSKSQIMGTFYFGMYLGITLIGAAHGLIFLPVVLSLIGPVSEKNLKSNLGEIPVEESNKDTSLLP